MGADLKREVSQAESDIAKQAQYPYLFRLWGGDPKRISQANIPANVYKAFGISA
jgi:hypothetical protein